MRMKFTEDGCSMFGCLRWGSSDAFRSAFSGFLCVGVVFFPSLPFMGVMLFPSSWLGNAPRGGRVVHPLRRTPCFPLFPPPSLLYLSSFLFFSLFFLPPQLSQLLLFLSLSFVPIFFSSSPLSCLLFIMSFSFVPFFSF